jgi:uncharacterized membrane protein YoaK (UPF0700 family)
MARVLLTPLKWPGWRKKSPAAFKPVTPAPKLGQGLLLTGLAGFIDAVGFIELGGYYTSFMSGNTTQLGNYLLDRPSAAALLPLGLLLLFFTGSTVGSLLSLASERFGPALVAALLFSSTTGAIALHFAGADSPLSMGPLAFGAGAQNALLSPAGSVRLGATFVTGTLFAAGQDLAKAIHRLAPRWRWTQHLLVWLSLLLGAALGAVSYQRLGPLALLAPAALHAAFCLGLALRQHKAGPLP